jgi:hypothetical protein
MFSVKNVAHQWLTRYIYQSKYDYKKQKTLFLLDSSICVFLEVQ